MNYLIEYKYKKKYSIKLVYKNYCYRKKYYLRCFGTSEVLYIVDCYK